MSAPNQVRFLPAAVLFTALIAFQSVGWLLAWQGLRFGAKIEAQKALFHGGKDFQQGTFHKDFIEKIKVGRKEIVLDGQLFDYKILSVQGDSLRISLFHDQKEQALLSVLGHVFKSERDPGSQHSMPLTLWLAKWLSATFILPVKSVLPAETVLFLLRQAFHIQFSKAQFAPGVFAPPPESAFLIPSLLV